MAIDNWGQEKLVYLKIFGEVVVGLGENNFLMKIGVKFIMDLGKIVVIVIGVILIILVVVYLVLV